MDYNTLCSSYYTIENLRGAYGASINPIPEITHNPYIPEEVRRVIVMPPISRRQPGRPRHTGYTSAGEKRHRRVCQKCGQQGHNRARCCNPPILNEAMSSSTPARTARKCSRCGGIGHNRRSRLCPLMTDENEQRNENITHAGLDTEIDEENINHVEADAEIVEENVNHTERFYDFDLNN